MSKGIRTARLMAFLLAGAALTYYLLSRSGSAASTMKSIADAVGGSDPGWLAAGFSLFFLSQFIRAWRWQLISHSHKITLSESLSLTTIHVGLGHLLPVRLSDLALVGLFRKYASIPAGSGAATVMLAKVMDVIAMGSVVAFSFLSGLSGPVVYVAAVTAAAGIGSLFFLPYFLGLLSSPVNRLFGNGKFASAWLEMTNSIRITKERRRTVTLAMLASISAWAVKLFMFQALLSAVGVHGLPLWQVFTACAVTDLTMALPVHGLLSMGTVEAGWVAGFALVGITGSLPGGLSVVEAGFSVHLLWLSMAVLLMLAGMLFLLIGSRKDNR